MYYIRCFVSVYISASAMSAPASTSTAPAPAAAPVSSTSTSTGPSPVPSVPLSGTGSFVPAAALASTQALPDTLFSLLQSSLIPIETLQQQGFKELLKLVETLIGNKKQ